MFCSNCGKQIIPGSKFCLECGAPIGQNQIPVSDSEPYQASNHQQASVPYQASVPQQAPIAQPVPVPQQASAPQQVPIAQPIPVPQQAYAPQQASVPQQALPSELPWFYIDTNNNRRIGPVDQALLPELIRTGIITSDTIVRRKDWADWKKAKNTELSQYFTDSAYTKPKTKISDKWLWMLAIVPLVVNIILSFIIPSHTIIIWIVTVALNILFIVLDDIYLKNNGIDDNSLIWFGFLLVPLYLFIRASDTTKNYAPGIIWCVLCVPLILISIIVRIGQFV